MNRIEQTIGGLTRASAWLNLLVVVVILAQVVLRYGFHHGLVALEEFIWHLYAAAFLFAIPHAMLQDRHVRVDVFHAKFSPALKCWVEIIGILLLLCPFLVVLLDHSINWVKASYQFSETSQNPTGLPYRWLIKSMIPASLFLLLLTALSRLVEQFRLLAGKA